MLTKPIHLTVKQFKKFSCVFFNTQMRAILDFYHYARVALFSEPHVVEHYDLSARNDISVFCMEYFSLARAF